MGASVLPDEIVARYRQFMTGSASSMTTEEVIKLLGAARDYLAAATSEIESSGLGDRVALREIRVALRNAAKGLLNRATGLDVKAQQALEQFIIEQPEFLADDYRFTDDFFSSNIDVWKLNLARFAHRPNLHFLEVGSFEGLSACWLLNNILTSESSKLTCIDTFDFAGQGSFSRQHQGAETMSIEARFDYNIKLTGSAHKVRKIGKLSRDALRSLSFSAYDYIYIDASHVASDVLEDTVLSWPLLKKGGVLTFDDYQWEQDLNPLNRPRLAIDAFLSIFKTQYKLIHKGYQVSVEKV
jgi:hypothetical protein